MDKVILTQENIGQEHICCAMSDKKSAEGVEAKKGWLACRMEEGLQFVKLNVRGKVFIEYLPAEYAWVPIEADGYTFINCLWVAGSFKGHGYGRPSEQGRMQPTPDKVLFGHRAMGKGKRTG